MPSSSPPEANSLIQVLSLLLSSGGVLYLLGRGVYNWWNDKLKAKEAEQDLKSKDLQAQLTFRNKEQEDELTRKRVEETARGEARKVLEDQGLQRIRDLEDRAKDADRRVESIMDTQHQRAQAFDILKAQYDRLEATNKTQAGQIAELQAQVHDLQTQLQEAKASDGEKARIIQELRSEITRLQLELNQCLGH